MFPVCFVDVPFVADIHNSASLLVVVFCRVSLSIVKTSFLDVVCLSQVFLFLHKNHDQKVTWGGKCLFSLHFQTVVHHLRYSGLELKQVRKQELRQRPWRDVSYWLTSLELLSLLYYRTQEYQSRVGTTHKGPSQHDH